MTYDALDGYVVLFGGFPITAGPTSDTWVFANDRWVNISLTAGTPPTPRYGMGMTYDALDGYVLAFGGGTAGTCGPSNAADCNDTWSFRAGKWSPLTTPVAPPPTWGMGMTYDAADGYVVLFGGSADAGTWNYSRGVWTSIAAASNATYVQPSPRHGMGMAYDAQDGYVLLFGGYGVNEVLGDTWSFVGGLWTELSPLPSPSPREAPMMTYDDPGGTVILFGGSTYLPDPSPPHQLNDTWSFAGGSWTKLTPGSAPAARGEGAIAYDVTDSCSLLFGGTEQLGTAGNQNDTWAWCNAPPLVGLSILVDPSIPLPGAVASFGASFRGGVSPFTYAWAFGDGATSASANPVHAYAAAGFYAVLLWLNDSAAHSANTTREVHVYVPLAVPGLTADPNPAFLEQPVNFSSTENGGTPPYTYHWEFGDGGTGGSLANITHVYTTNGPFQVELTVSDTPGAIVHAFVNITIQLQALVQSTTATGSAPLVVSFTGGAQGGHPPYSYSWNFGDGSPISTVQNPTHIFGSSGSYDVVLIVTDAGGNHAVRSTLVQIGGGTSMSSLALGLLTGGLGFAAGVAAMGGLSLWRRRRTKKPPREGPKVESSEQGVR